MHYPTFRYQWEWDFTASPAALWPYVADTNHFNRAAGLPSVEVRAGPTETNARRHLRAWRYGFPLQWEEEPFEWVRPYRHGVLRRYTRGPVAVMRTQADLLPLPGGGTHLVYQVWARPRNLLGLAAIPLQIGILSARKFDSIFREYERLAATGAPVDDAGLARLAASARARLAETQKALFACDVDRRLAGKLVALMVNADEQALARIRPYKLAAAWAAPPRTVLEVCLWATRVGLLDFQWDLLCPLCRNARESRSSLREIISEVHCDTCQIDFQVNFDRLVEITFRPNPAIRQVEALQFCVGGPQVTPHIVAQQLLPPWTEESVTVPLEPGRYRLRSLLVRGGQLIAVAPDGQSVAAACLTQEGWPTEETRLGVTPTLQLHNLTDKEHLFILEHMTWADDAVTAADVTSLQLFRDLFASEALRPGEEVAVGSLTVLFTDLKDSTALYREIGDAVAFGRVADHFGVLKAAIAAEDGVLIKTIGDAVMATFRYPVAALRAAVQAQREFARPHPGSAPLVLKAGIHTGTSIAVTLNDRLDYFGTTVNVAARIQGLSQGDDIVISSAVRRDPEVAEWLANGQQALQLTSFQAHLKGVDTAFQLWRVTRTS